MGRRSGPTSLITFVFIEDFLNLSIGIYKIPSFVENFAFLSSRNVIQRHRLFFGGVSFGGEFKMLQNCPHICRFKKQCQVEVAAGSEPRMSRFFVRMIRFFVRMIRFFVRMSRFFVRMIRIEFT